MSGSVGVAAGRRESLRRRDPIPSGRTVAGRRILVVGLARTGLAVARYLVACSARVRVFDSRPAADFSKLTPALPPAVETSFQVGPAEALRGIDLVVTSPGVPGSSELLRQAVARGLPIWSEIELASGQLRVPLVAVTGTNGKSTTVCLLGKLLEEGGFEAFVGGNLGNPLIDAVDRNIDVAVAEVSSFQLEWIEDFRPKVAVVLNVGEDHLDRHGNLQEYAATKLRIFQNQQAGDLAVINRDDDLLRRHRPRAGVELLSFGLEPVDRGAFVEGDQLVVHWQEGKEAYSLSGFRLPGRHNLANAMAAVLAARALGVSQPAVQAGLSSFQGLPHRMEFVRDLAGVTYINDSKGTNVDSVLQALASCTGPVILLSGGTDKGARFQRLVELVRRRVKLLVLFGAASEKLASALAGSAPLRIVTDLSAAVSVAATSAVPGDIVLLSPGCASFDQFRDYADRGEQFRKLVAEL